MTITSVLINFSSKVNVNMAFTIVKKCVNCNLNKYKLNKYLLYCTQTQSNVNPGLDNDEEFRVLELFPMKKFQKSASKRFQDAQVMPPREKKMPIDQDWPSVWPAARTFQPSVVPLPVYQGYNQKKAPPGKFGNAELMKIPNFLHLTPPAIKRHCEAIKKFCTKWPASLDTEKKCEDNFPLEIITTDYCHSSPTIRDERSRIVTLTVRLKNLQLDYHAKDKILRLVGEDRYDAKKDALVIVADRCPLRKQNYDYLMYLFTALYHESKITEPWEAEKTEADMEKFFFEGSRHQKHALDTINSIRAASGSKEIDLAESKDNKEINDYGEGVSGIINDGEYEYTLQQYKESVAKVIGINLQIKETHGELLPST